MRGASSISTSKPSAETSHWRLLAADRRPGDAQVAGRDRDQVREVARGAAALLDHLDAALGRDERRVDVVHRLVDAAAERAVQGGERQQARVVLRELAVVLERDPARLAARELEREAGRGSPRAAGTARAPRGPRRRPTGC